MRPNFSLRALCLAASAGFFLIPRLSVAEPGLLQAASPDWRDQVIYFVMTDRFMDGDKSNDDQGRGEFNPKDGNFYSGGDLAGVRQKLDYIQGLGATAVWITPPVANVWYDPAMKMAGYHGYWAENFKKIDAHLGTLDDYRRLSMELHRRGMYLIQDIVVNHTGDFFRYDGPYDPGHVEKNFSLKSGMIPARPTQYPFSLDDAAQPDQRRAAVYHWTPDVTDYNDANQRLTYQVSSLDDLNTENPVVREALRDAYGFWISSVGVDGFRFDTVPYVEHDFYNDFIYSTSAAAPGVGVLARRLGKDDFLTFGEVWSNGSPFSDKEEKDLASYLGTASRPELGAVLNFPLLVDLRAVFAKGAPAAQLSYRLDGISRHFRGGRAAINLVDNQDMARFLAEGSEDGLVQALTVVFTIPGIPLVYAGTEQGFRETRASMFAAGWGSGGRDHFDASNPLYELIRRLADLRRREPVFRRGALVPLGGAAAGPGPLAYRLDGDGERALVLINSADEESVLAGLDTGLPPGTLLDVLFSRGLTPRRLQVGEGGRLTLSLPARAVLVLKSSGKTAPVAAVRGDISVDGFADNAVLTGLTTVQGTSQGVDGVFLVVDGRASRAIPARMGSDGRWTASFDASTLADGEHSLLAVSGSRTPPYSAVHPFSVSVPWTLAKKIDDPIGDDRGAAGSYVYPTSAGFQGRADIESVSLYRRGAGAKLTIKMAHGLSDAWNPPFGFDHVCFDVFISFPGLSAAGAAGLPRLNARMPEGAKWNYAAFLGGWKVALYGAGAATKDSFGPQVQPVPSVVANKAEGSISVAFDLDAFKGVTSFDGARFYVTTWDYDGVEGTPRALAPKPGDFVFGGGRPEDPRIMDDTPLFP
jgi:glycosidase